MNDVGDYEWLDVFEELADDPCVSNQLQKAQEPELLQQTQPQEQHKSDVVSMIDGIKRLDSYSNGQNLFCKIVKML